MASSDDSLAVESCKPVSFRTEHRDMIHDVKVDYFGKTVATASSDCTVRLFRVVRDQHFLDAVLEGHRGPVWSVSWAPPRFGRLLASCGYDRRLIIWGYSKDRNGWYKVLDDASGYNSSLNCVQFAANDSDSELHLIVGCSDGTVVHYRSTVPPHKWQKGSAIQAHASSVNAISFQCDSAQLRFASSGSDDVAKIYEWTATKNTWTCVALLKGHSNAVRDVCWAPLASSTCSRALLATGSEDKSVRIWKEVHTSATGSKKWTQSAVLKFGAPVWSVSWNQLGNVLAVAFGDNCVELFKENATGKWQRITSVTPKVS